MARVLAGDIQLKSIDDLPIVTDGDGNKSVEIPSIYLDDSRTIFIRDIKGEASVEFPIVIKGQNNETFGGTLSQLSITAEYGYIQLIPNKAVANDWFLQG